MIKGLLDRTGVAAAEVEEVFMGNVVSASQGQAPARQAALYAGFCALNNYLPFNRYCIFEWR